MNYVCVIADNTCIKVIYTRYYYVHYWDHSCRQQRSNTKYRLRCTLRYSVIFRNSQKSSKSDILTAKVFILDLQKQHLLLFLRHDQNHQFGYSSSPTIRLISSLFRRYSSISDNFILPHLYSVQLVLICQLWYLDLLLCILSIRVSSQDTLIDNMTSISLIYLSRSYDYRHMIY